MLMEPIQYCSCGSNTYLFIVLYSDKDFYQFFDMCKFWVPEHQWFNELKCGSAVNACLDKWKLIFITMMSFQWLEYFKTIIIWNMVKKSFMFENVNYLTKFLKRLRDTKKLGWNVFYWFSVKWRILCIF